MGIYQPFSSEQGRRLHGLLSQGDTSIGGFIALRRKLSGEDLPLDGLRRLCDAEPELRARLAERILPSILRHAQGLLRSAPPTLSTHTAGQSARTRLGRAEVAGWLAHLFLGTLPQPAPDHPHLAVAPLLSAHWPQELAKLRCLLAYFDRIAEAAPAGTLEIERIVVAARSREAWLADASPLVPLQLHTQSAIEEAEGCRQVDFANRFLGGGVLSGGCVQEEIRFAVAPELLVGLLVSPYMRDEEAIVLRGAERFSATRGYAQTLEFAGHFADPCARDPDGTPRIELVAIDALDYRRRDPSRQRTEADLLRELGKARAGFLGDAQLLPVATGNWGCGAFFGDPALKAVLQWLAASSEGRTLRYFSFGDVRVGDLAGFAEAARRRHGTVGALFQRLLAVRSLGGGSELYPRLLAN